MNFLTHIMISKMLHRHLSKAMDLDKNAFIYGNIKPDLSPQCLRNPHILENYLLIVSNDSNRLSSKKTPIKEFSVELGIVCHFICDFFCYCHLDSVIYHKLPLHFLYEIRLHLVLCFMLVRRKMNIESSRRFRDKNLGAMVMGIRKEYIAKRKTLRNDIEYAFLASLLACNLIYTALKSETAPEDAVGFENIKAFYSPYRV